MIMPKSYLLVLENKLQRSYSHDLALTWEPKAEKVDSISNDIVSYIQSLKSQLSNESAKDESFVSDLFIKNKGAQELYLKLMHYKMLLFTIDSSFANIIND